MIAHFLNRGHTLEELVNLSITERLFYQAAWEVEIGYMEEAFNKQLGEVKNIGK